MNSSWKFSHLRISRNTCCSFRQGAKMCSWKETWLMLLLLERVCVYLKINNPSTENCLLVCLSWIVTRSMCITVQHTIQQAYRHKHRRTHEHLFFSNDQSLIKPLKGLRSFFSTRDQFCQTHCTSNLALLSEWSYVLLLIYVTEPVMTSAFGGLAAGKQ